MRCLPVCLLLLALTVATAALQAPASPPGRDSSQAPGAQSTAAAAINPADVVGTWELNLRKSSWGALPPPKSATVNILRYDQNGMQWTAQETDEHGNSIALEWQGALNGLPQPATGTDAGVTYAFQQTDEGILEVVTFPDGSRITSLGTISAGGKTLTMRRHMTSPVRGVLDWTEVYDKVAR